MSHTRRGSATHSGMDDPRIYWFRRGRGSAGPAPPGRPSSLAFARLGMPQRSSEPWHPPTRVCSPAMGSTPHSPDALSAVQLIIEARGHQPGRTHARRRLTSDRWFAVSTTVWQHLPPMGGSETAARVTMRWAAVTEVGRIRSVNEDSLLADPPAFVVADGMGGHEAGDVASALAIERLGGLVDSPPATPEEVSVLLGSANSEILDAGASQDDERSMGTTLVGLVLIDAAAGPSWLVFNIGDSRIYRCMDGVVDQLSVDHSYVQELLDAGRITEPAARIHPQRNVVTRALGVDPEAKADLWLRSPVPGERFMLCSDGLSGELAPDALNAVVSQPRSPEEVAAALVEMALAAGGKDNITVIVVDVEGVDGVSHDDHITSPRDEPTVEQHAVVPAGVERLSEIPGPDGTDPHEDPDAAHAGGDSSEAASMISVPQEVVAGLPAGVQQATSTDPDGTADRSMIAGVPSELPRAEVSEQAPTFEVAGPTAGHPVAGSILGNVGANGSEVGETDTGDEEATVEDG